MTPRLPSTPCLVMRMRSMHSIGHRMAHRWRVEAKTGPSRFGRTKPALFAMTMMMKARGLFCGASSWYAGVGTQIRVSWDTTIKVWIYHRPPPCHLRTLLSVHLSLVMIPNFLMHATFFLLVACHTLSNLLTIPVSWSAGRSCTLGVRSLGCDRPHDFRTASSSS